MTGRENRFEPERHRSCQRDEGFETPRGGGERGNQLYYSRILLILYTVDLRRSVPVWVQRRVSPHMRTYLDYA